MESLEALPVVVKKSKRLLEGLAGPSVQERQLCPQGKLLSLIEANGWVRIHDLCNPAIHCLIDSHCYINTLWVNKGSSSLEQSSCQESYLLAINSSKDLHLFSISHIPLDREGENEEKGKLIFVQLAAMSRRQVSSNLSKAQLGSSVEFLRPLGSNKGNIVLLVNENVLLTITSDRVSHQLSFLAIFSVEPNMEEFYDELLPHYVEKISDICISWPLVFTVTGDGIVLVYGIDDGKCIGAINPLEYSRMFCTHHPDSELLVQTLSKSSFQHLSVNPDLSNLAVSTNTNHILLVHIPTYFANFPSHYSKSFQQRPLKRFTQVVRSSQSNLTAEEEERERLVYGGLTPRHKGMGVTHTGTHIGHYTIKNRYKSLKKSVDNFDSNGGLSLARDTVIMDRNQLTDHSSSKGSHQWYVKSSYREGNRSGSIVTPVTNLKPKNIPVTASITSTDISSSSTYPIQCILPPVEDHVTPDSTLFHLDYSRGIVVAYYTEGTDQPILTSDYSVNYIAVYRISHQCYTVIKLPSTSWLVLPANPDKPVFLLSDTSLSLAAFTLSQEDFVAKVLIYGSAGVAEEVCHLNQWDQCSLPLNALETALQLRQLDIVSFFLRNRESSHEGNGVVEESSPAVPPDQLDAAVSLLSNVIKRNHDREHSSQFAGQLLQITLNFLLRFIKSHSNTGSGLSLDEDEAHISPNAITQHIQNLRRYLPHGKQDKPHTLTEEFDHLLQSLIRAEPWHSLSSEEVVEKALINGDVPLVQAFLIQRMLKWKKSPESVDHAPLDDITFDHFNKIGIGLIMKILSNRNIKLATSYISEMGGDVEETVRFIFQHTIQRQLRDNLSAIMSQENWITSNELDALEYLHLLEIYYPNQSYEDAIVIYHGGMHKGMELMYDNKRGNVLDYYPESFGGNHPVVWESVSLSKPFSSKNQKQRGLYIQVPLYVVLLWDSQTRQRVLYEALVYSEASKDMSLCSTLVSLVDQLIYHIKHHNTEASLSLVPLLPPLTVYNLLTSLTHCSHYVKDVLHNSLARNGFYCQPNIETFPELLYRLRQLHNLFSLPHPLSAIDQSNVSLTQFHTLLISYLIEKEFIGLLYLYLDHFKLALDKKSIIELKLDPSSSGIPPWAQLMVQCRLTAENQHEPEYIFSTSLTCSHLLYNSPTVNEGLINGHVFASLATVMYSMHSFDQAMDSSHANELWYIDPVVLKGSLGAYPSLQAAIFPPPPTKLSPAQSQDVTVYELLKGTTKFDISRLFKWQITNKFAAANEDIETQVEPPHFSQSALSHRYSQTDKLSYTYYLYRGQPSFAFANFVAVKLINKTNNTKRIGKVISKVYRLSLSDFTNSHLISSCAAFLEMLSRDSTHLRIDTQSAVRIYEYWFNKIESSEDFASSDADHHKLAIRNKLSSQFLQLYESPDNHMISSSLLDKLIKSTKHVITSNAINACSIEAENYWLLVQQFCKCHSLSPTTSYLKECAREGEWLPMLCHAQLYGISTQEVLNVVEKYFSKPVVKEHLQLAISTMSTTPPPQSPSLSEVSSGSGRGKPRSKRKYMGGLPPNGHTQKKKDEKLPASPVDVRSKFYSRVKKG
jgi:spatacsin